MAAATATSLTRIGQDRPRRRTMPWLTHWRSAVCVVVLAALWMAAILSKLRWLDAAAGAITGGFCMAAILTLRARRERERLARTRNDSDQTTMLDLGSAARASQSLDDFLYNIAMGLAGMTGASSVCILLRDRLTGRFYCRYRYPMLAVGLNSEPLWLDKDAFAVRRLRSLSHPLPLNPDDFPSWVDALSGEARMRRRFECDVLTALESRLLVQVLSHNDLSAIVSIGPGPSTRYEPGIERMLVAASNQVSLAIENSYLVQRVAEGERLRREVEMAAEVQRKLLPSAAPDFEHIDIATFFQPARDVAGDYFDFFPVDRDRLALCVADVAGKGLSAALLMSTVKALLRSHAIRESHAGHSAADVIASVNRLLCQFTDAPRYTTLFYAEFDVNTRRLTYVNAGHNPPHLVGSGESLPLDAGGPVLGLFPDAAFTEGSVPFYDGDALVAYTDGVLEACNPAGVEFGEHNVLSAVRRNPATADAMLNAALRDLRTWCDGLPFDDDATLLVARVR